MVFGAAGYNSYVSNPSHVLSESANFRNWPDQRCQWVTQNDPQSMWSIDPLLSMGLAQPQNHPSQEFHPNLT